MRHTEICLLIILILNTEKLLLKHTVIKMAFIKKESEDVKIEEDTEQQTGRFNSQSLSSVILCLESLLFVSLFLRSFISFVLWDCGGANKKY